MQVLTLRPDFTETLTAQSRREERPVEDILSDAVERY